MSSRAPIDLLLDKVDWIATDYVAKSNADLPYATHEGVLEFAGLSIHCYRLNNGMRVFDADDVARLFGV